MVYALSIEIDSLTKANERYALKNDYLQSDNERLNDIISKSDLRLEAQKNKYEAEVDLYKAKAKGRFRSFLLGTGLGALVVAIVAFL